MYLSEVASRFGMSPPTFRDVQAGAREFGSELLITSDLWHEWRGGEVSPLDQSDDVIVCLRSNSIGRRRAGRYRWTDRGSSDDIVAYIPVSEWINVHGLGSVFVPATPLEGIPPPPHSHVREMYSSCVEVPEDEFYSEQSGFSVGSGSDWTAHDGLNRPVSPTTKVRVRLRGGDEVTDTARYFTWRHGPVDSTFDIVAYRIIKDKRTKNEMRLRKVLKEALTVAEAPDEWVHDAVAALNELDKTTEAHDA